MEVAQEARCPGKEPECRLLSSSIDRDLLALEEDKALQAVAELTRSELSAMARQVEQEEAQAQRTVALWELLAVVATLSSAVRGRFLRWGMEMPMEMEISTVRTVCAHALGASVMVYLSDVAWMSTYG